MISFFKKYSFIPVLMMVLAGCSSPPETTGVCRSCKPYFVRGTWHKPQKHYEYDEVGLASWYGPGFHGKSKAYGEPYNQYEMTAAHVTLPLPTIAEVTNLSTGKKIKVLVDDRGPYTYKGRIIDLSVAASKVLGIYKKGTGRVRVRALPEESERFARHLKQYKHGRDPKRRWLHVYQQDIARNKNALHSIHYKPYGTKPKPLEKILRKNAKAPLHLDALLYTPKTTRLKSASRKGVFTKTVAKSKSVKLRQKSSKRFIKKYDKKHTHKTIGKNAKKAPKTTKNRLKSKPSVKLVSARKNVKSLKQKRVVKKSNKKRYTKKKKK